MAASMRVSSGSMSRVSIGVFESIGLNSEWLTENSNSLDVVNEGAILHVQEMLVQMNKSELS